MYDYNCDGSYVFAASAKDASARFSKLYGHAPESVREWTADDQAELDRMEEGK